MPNAGYIGVGVHSHHYYANFAHIVYLNRDGTIMVTQLNEEGPSFYRDVLLRGAVASMQSLHPLHLEWTETDFAIRIDDFTHLISLASMPRVLGAGAIRLQSHKTWMARMQKAAFGDPRLVK